MTTLPAEAEPTRRPGREGGRGAFARPQPPAGRQTRSSARSSSSSSRASSRRSTPSARHRPGGGFSRPPRRRRARWCSPSRSSSRSTRTRSPRSRSSTAARTGSALTFAEIARAGRGHQGPAARLDAGGACGKPTRRSTSRKVRGAGGQRLLADLVSLVRFALHKRTSWCPFAEQVEARFENWLAQQENRGRTLHRRAAPVAGADPRPRRRQPRRREDDFDYTPFAERGGRGRRTRSSARRPSRCWMS